METYYPIAKAIALSGRAKIVPKPRIRTNNDAATVDGEERR